MSLGAVVAVLLAASGTAGADGSLVIVLPVQASFVSGNEVVLTVGVTCAPLLHQSDGTLTLMVSEPSQSKTATTSASIGIACDGHRRLWVRVGHRLRHRSEREPRLRHGRRSRARRWDRRPATVTLANG